MSTSLIFISSIVYILFLFWIAYFANKKAKQGKSLVNNPYTYALSLAVYCTAWTFYGSVGKAASPGGLSFLTIYVGPILVAPLWIFLLRKIILISKSQRITSIADFISSRYGKSTTLGVVATLIAVVGIIPYISLQLKAVDSSFNLMANQDDWLGTFLDGSTFYRHKAFIIVVILTIFTILFGTRHLDPNERHEGLVAAIAFESIWKLLAFLSIGIFVTFGIYNGFGDLFYQASQKINIDQIFSFQNSEVDSWSWGWMVLLSMSAIILLPRQFHMMVVENTNVKFVEKASWLFPLYLLLINLFVLPIACGGLLQFPAGEVQPDNFVLGLPLHYGKNILALFVYLGGLSAATGMVIVAIIALSIMMSNNLVLPFLLKSEIIEDRTQGDLSKYLLNVRRISIVIIMFLAYSYFNIIGSGFSLVSIGLISFAAIAQFLPVVIGGLYWKNATAKAALASMLVGIFVWGFTLSIPTLMEVGLLSKETLMEGYFGLNFLKPYALFGMEEGDHITHSAFWSLLFNTGTYIIVSLFTTPKPVELTQADLFIDIEKYTNQDSIEVVKKEAKIEDISNLLHRFLGKHAARKALNNFAKNRNIDLENLKTADSEIINFAETQLAGSIGVPSAKLVLQTVVKEDPITLEEVLKILDKTQEAIQYSKALEKKSNELQTTTLQLQAANEQLKELDRLKADFITTVTHELRTPITSIKSLTKIIHDNPSLEEQKKTEFLEIMVSETERIARLINEVLELEKIQSTEVEMEMKKLNLTEVVKKVMLGFSEILKTEKINIQGNYPKKKVIIYGNFDRLTQVVVNLISNAIKFCDDKNGLIETSIEIEDSKWAVLKVKDNGIGISKVDQKIIFDKFTQVSSQKAGKPKGSGLGLYICKEIVERHAGEISVKSNKKEKWTIFTMKIPLKKNNVW